MYIYFIGIERARSKASKKERIGKIITIFCPRITLRDLLRELKMPKRFDRTLDFGGPF